MTQMGRWAILAVFLFLISTGRSMIQMNHINALQSRRTATCAEFSFFDLSLALMDGLPGLYARMSAPGEYEFSLFET